MKHTDTTSRFMQETSAAGERLAKRALSAFAILTLASVAVSGQGPAGPAGLKGSVDLGRLPGEVAFFANALGNRITAAGNERVVLAGTLTRSGTSMPATVTLELPWSYRLDTGGGRDRSVAFDGKNVSASDMNVSEDDLDAVESLLEDSAESMFQLIVSNAAGLRVLGRAVRMDDGKTPDYKGPWATVYQVTAATKSRAGTVRDKYYFFDSSIRQPITVRYQLTKSDGTQVHVETARTGWIQQNGQWTPTKVTRFENGKATLVLQTGSTAFGPARNDGAFRQH